jgi:hypothetical protein
MMTDQQKHKFEMARQMAKDELEQIDREINVELARIKERLLELQRAKKAVKQIYDGACARIGVRSVIDIKEFNLADLVRPN